MAKITEEIRLEFYLKKEQTILSGQQLLSWYWKEILTSWVEPDFKLFHSIKDWVDSAYKDFCKKNKFSLEYVFATHDNGTNRVGTAEVKVIAGKNSFKYTLSFQGNWSGMSNRKINSMYVNSDLESFAENNLIETAILKTELNELHSLVMLKCGVL